MTSPTPSPSSDQAAGEPIPMLLFCPKCGTQHIDAPEEFKPVGMCTCAFSQDECETCEANREAYQEIWTNPPHKSHLCHACKKVWRPADVATTGVASIKTKGKADTWDSTAPATGSALMGRRPFAFCRVEDVMNNDSLLAQVGAKRGDKLYLLEEIKQGTLADAARMTIKTSAAILEELGLLTKADELRALLVSAAPASPAASMLSDDAILAIAIDHGLGTAVVESIVKAILAASMGRDRPTPPASET